MQELSTRLNRLIPPILVLFAALGWLAWGAYDFMKNPLSALNVENANAARAEEELKVAKEKLAKGEQFYRDLDLTRGRIRLLIQQLDATKSSLTSDIDLANFLKVIALEAKKVGVSIRQMRPDAERKREHYIEVPYSIGLRGAYVQVLVFFDRLARLQRVVRIADFELRPTGNTSTKYVELEGTAQLVSYKYLGTSADDIINKPVMKATDISQIQQGAAK